MTFLRLRLRRRAVSAALRCIVVAPVLFSQLPVRAQANSSSAHFSRNPGAAERASALSIELPAADAANSDTATSASSADGELAPLEGGASAAFGGNPERPNIAAPGEWNQPAFSRIGIGADVSPLGIGIKSAIVLDRYLDARLMGNFFNYDSGRFEINGFSVDAKLHMASAAAALDWYPFNSIWRLSPGIIFFNGNQISATAQIAPGTSFDMENQTFYSANSNPATGAVPLTGSGILGLHTHRVAATITGGFGKFVPRSNRHWSFPSEFGVAFTGAPSIAVNMSGWACTDASQTACSNLADPNSPITVEFNRSLQSTLNKWRRDLNKVQIYPIFSYSVVYSFNIR
jgi:hypothetical protein